MLNYTLLHPELLSTLSAIGHGGRVVLADANFPIMTATNPTARIIYLNLRPGMLTIPDVLAPLLDAVDVEAATLMAAPDDSPVPAHDDYTAALGDALDTQIVDRWDFYKQTRAEDVALLVATGDGRLCSNLILTLAARGV